MLAKKLEYALHVEGYSVEVFNTSEPEHRFQDLHENLQAAELWEPQAKQWERELREYLKNNILQAAGYVLLVTRNSAQKRSEWIAFEIEVAAQAGKERGWFSFPCLAEGTHSSLLPGDAAYFQAVEINTDDGFTILVSALVQALERGSGNVR